MDRVLIISDWRDGPLSGVAYFGEELCIYEKIFSEEIDEYIDKYRLTYISKSEYVLIKKEWEKWVYAVKHKKHYNYEKANIISVVAKKHNQNNLIMSANFTGCVDKNGIPENFYVEWF